MNYYNMLKLSVTVIVVVSLIYGVQLKQIFSRIAGGHIAQPFSAPFVVSLQHNNHHVCGGAILSTKYVVTSATCVLENNPTQVLAGSQKLLTNIERYKILNITIHKKYSYETQINDIAMIEVEHEFVLSRSIQIIPLKYDGIEWDRATELFGWGYNNNDKDTKPNDLQILYQNYLGYDTCKAISNYDNLNEKQFCTFVQYTQGACYGDEGSPLIINNRIAGILNWFSECGDGKPDVFLDFDYYSKFFKLFGLD